jgi:hypothetical protein
MNDNDITLVIRESMSDGELWEHRIKECNGEPKKGMTLNQ